MTPQAMLHKLLTNWEWVCFVQDAEREVITAGLQALNHRYGVYAYVNGWEDECSQPAATIHNLMWQTGTVEEAIRSAQGYLEKQEDFTRHEVSVVDHFFGNKVLWNSDAWKAEHTPAPIFHSIEDVVESVSLTRTQRFFLSERPWDEVRRVIHQPNGPEKLKVWINDYIAEHDQQVISPKQG